MDKEMTPERRERCVLPSLPEFMKEWREPVLMREKARFIQRWRQGGGDEIDAVEYPRWFQ